MAEFRGSFDAGVGELSVRAAFEHRVAERSVETRGVGKVEGGFGYVAEREGAVGCTR